MYSNIICVYMVLSRLFRCEGNQGNQLHTSFAFAWNGFFGSLAYGPKPPKSDRFSLQKKKSVGSKNFGTQIKKILPAAPGAAPHHLNYLPWLNSPADRAAPSAARRCLGPCCAPSALAQLPCCRGGQSTARCLGHYCALAAQEQNLCALTWGMKLSTATNEKVPYYHMYIYIYIYTYLHIHTRVCI